MKNARQQLTDDDGTVDAVGDLFLSGSHSDLGLASVLASASLLDGLAQLVRSETMSRGSLTTINRRRSSTNVPMLPFRGSLNNGQLMSKGLNTRVWVETIHFWIAMW